MCSVYKIMENKVLDDPREKLTRLIRYTTGDAKEMEKKYTQFIAGIEF